MKYRVLKEFLPGVIVGQECEVNNFYDVVIRWEHNNNCGCIVLSDTYAKLRPDIFEPVKWKPEDGEWYYIVYSDGRVDCQTWLNHPVDNGFYNFGNCFRTKAEAEAARDKIKEVLKSL